MMRISFNKPVAYLAPYQRREITYFLHQPQSSVKRNLLKNSKTHLENSAENSDLFLNLALMKTKPDSEIFENHFLKFSKLVFKIVKAQFRDSAERFKKNLEKNSVNTTMRNASIADATKQAKNSVNEPLRHEAQFLPHEQCTSFINEFEHVIRPRKKQSAAINTQRSQFSSFSKRRG